MEERNGLSYADALAAITASKDLCEIIEALSKYEHWDDESIYHDIAAMMITHGEQRAWRMFQSLRRDKLEPSSCVHSLVAYTFRALRQ